MVGLVTNPDGSGGITLQKYLSIDELSKRFFIHTLPFFQVGNELHLPYHLDLHFIRSYRAYLSLQVCW